MDQQFSLSWNNFHGNLSKGFAGLLGKAEFVDVTIAVEGHLIQAHKVILSICSPYFKKMFLLNPCQHPIVVLRDVTYKAMKDLLQFMYQGEVSVKREDLSSFIGTAELLEIKGLTNKQTDENSVIEEEDATDTQNTSTKNSDLNHIHNNTSQNELDLTKQCEIIQRLQKFTSLKRKSEEFLQKNYFSTDVFINNTDKRQKIKEQYHNKSSENAVSSNTYDNYHKIYNDTPLDAAINYTNKGESHNSGVHGQDLSNSCPEESVTPDNNVEIKPECDDDDIVVTEPGACTTPKQYDTRQNDDFPTSKEHCTGLSSLFVDLKSLLNRTNDYPRTDFEDTPRNLTPTNHHLVTIPQKEDGKKKYPQRSCRLCWKNGKRRDTRFMCKTCEMPFCKYPCFDMHYQTSLKPSLFHRGGNNEFLAT